MYLQEIKATVRRRNEIAELELQAALEIVQSYFLLWMESKA